MIRRMVQRVLARVGKVVAEDDLFEKPGERPPATPLATPTAPAPTALATTSTARSRPATGCIPADLATLQALLKPTGRPLLVNHWATWCDPCVEELPRLVRAHAAIADSVDFLGVSWDLFDHPGDAAKVARDVARFADGAGVGYGSVLFTGEPAELFRALNLSVELIPQTFVFAADGRMVLHHAGVLTDDDVGPLLAAARAAS
jgi:thiol-disulfide isomerase/thioredoxin